jgi:hypothetical protein
MAELEVKSCGWKITHSTHPVVQVSQDSFICPGYDTGLEDARYWAEHGG